MVRKNNSFKLNNANIVPVNIKKYLLDILNPTSKNTKYYEPPPEKKNF